MARTLSSCGIPPSRPAAAYVHASRRPSVSRRSLSAGTAPDASMEAVAIIDASPPVEISPVKRGFPAWVVLPAGVVAVLLAGVAHRRMSSHGYAEVKSYGCNGEQAPMASRSSPVVMSVPAAYACSALPSAGL
jgi:hypothetical protein